MKKVVLIATVLLAITSMLVIVSQSSGAPSVQPADAVEGVARSAEYWLDNQADAQVFMEAYTLSPSPAAHWVPDFPEDARLYIRAYRVDIQHDTPRSIPDFPLDGRVYNEHYR